MSQAVPASPPASPQGVVPVDAAATTGFKLTTPVSLVGAAVAVVGSFLAWFDFLGVTSNSFDIAAPFLIDNQTTASDTVTVGLLVVLLGGAAAAACLVPSFGARVQALRVLGLGIIAVAGLFVFQMVQTANDIGGSLGDVIGIGPFVTGIAGIALLSGK